MTCPRHTLNITSLLANNEQTTSSKRPIGPNWFRFQEDPRGINRNTHFVCYKTKDKDGKEVSAAVTLRLRERLRQRWFLGYPGEGICFFPSFTTAARRISCKGAGLNPNDLHISEAKTITSLFYQLLLTIPQEDSNPILSRHLRAAWSPWRLTAQIPSRTSSKRSNARECLTLKLSLN